MGIELVVAILGVIAAVAIPLWIHAKMHPKRQLRYRVEVTPLLAEGAGSTGRLMIALDGQAVTNPQVLTLTVWSTGRADISSSSFDSGEPLTFDLGVQIVEEVPSNYNGSPSLQISAPDKALLRPALLHRKFQSTLRVIVDGEPTVRVNRVLADIDVVRDGVSAATQAIDTSRKRLRITPLLVWTGILVIGLVILIVGLVIYSFDTQAYLPWGVVGMLTMMVSLLAIIIIGVYRFFRWAGRNIEARSGLRRD